MPVNGVENLPVTLVFNNSVLTGTGECARKTKTIEYR